MGRMDDSNSFRGKSFNSVQPKSLVRVERAGILGLTTCEFDSATEEHLSTRRPHESKYGMFELLGMPGDVVDIEVPCPIIGKCASCPSRDLETTCDRP